MPVYPSAHRSEILDDYHGTLVADPYRWMENPATPESRQWTQAQNELSDQWIPQELKTRIHQRLETLSNYTRRSAPFKRGNRYFFWEHEGLQNQPVLYWLDRFSGTPETLLNPNALSHQGTVAIVSAEPSRDGKHVVYGLSQRGSDWQEIRIREIESGRDLAESLHHTKFAALAWHPHHHGFYYNRYPDPSTVALEDINCYNSVYWHALHSDQADDVLVYEYPEQKDLDFRPQISDDGQYLFLNEHLGTDRRNGVLYRPLKSEGPFIRLFEQGEAYYHFLGNVGEYCYFQTDLNAQRGRVIAVNLSQLEQIQEVIPESADTLNDVLLAGHRFVCLYLHHAHHQMLIYQLDGQFDRELALPGLGSVVALNGKQNDDELFFGFSSFLFPTTVYLYQLQAHTLVSHFQPELDFKVSDYITRQVFAPSPDGTQVPVFLTHRRDLALSPDNPVLMYGYGGFRHALTPSFAAHQLLWLEQGGIYAVVNTRGGSEYGSEWYAAGTLERKQNVFDDFMAAAEYLIKSGLTSARKLAIRGGSNGGLLVGACMLQRPELLGAVVCQVPVLDMLRYHRFTIGRYWTGDYGNAEENPEHFRFLQAYSPVHNVQPGQQYPPVLITTGDHDDRVVPSHAKKFAASLQYHSPDSLTLLRVNTDVGHGLGTPLSKSISELAEIYAFLARSLDLNWQ